MGNKIHMLKNCTPEIKERKLTKLQRQVLVGSLLGDGHLRSNQGTGMRERFSLTILQSGAHKEYVFHLYEIFKSFCTSPPRKYSFSDERNPEKIYERWYFSTTLQSCFRFYGRQFYRDKKKRVPPLIKRILTPLAVAYWYMDDGAAKWQGKSLALRFCTDNYSLLECEQLIQVLEDKFHLQCTLQKKGGAHRIYVKQSSYATIKELILPHIISEMLHKFPREY